MHEAYADRFHVRVDSSGGPSACWPWIGSRLPTGYGRFCPKWKVGMNAHRVAWEIANGRPLVAGEDVCHHCDNPPCCNPAHLFAGSRSDNMRDMVSKGRHGHTGCPGMSHPMAKLTDDQVREIRTRWASDRPRQGALAQEYGVSKGLIGLIIRRKAWAHLD